MMLQRISKLKRNGTIMHANDFITCICLQILSAKSAMGMSWLIRLG